MAVKTLMIDGKEVSAEETQTILDAARENGIFIPTLCHLEGITDIGACRLCMVEVEGSPKLTTSCVTKISDGMVVRTSSEQLDEYRKMIVELLFAEGNHTCAVCVANGHCELQDMAIKLGMTHSRFEYTYPKKGVDISYMLFGIDHNRCIPCTRCIRTCDEIEGAHAVDVAGRGPSPSGRSRCRVYREAGRCGLAEGRSRRRR